MALIFWLLIFRFRRGPRQAERCLPTTSTRQVGPGGGATFCEDFGVAAEAVAGGGVEAADEVTGFLDERCVADLNPMRSLKNCRVTIVERCFLK